jgi:hypothetical protein
MNRTPDSRVYRVIMQRRNKNIGKESVKVKKGAKGKMRNSLRI